MKGGINRVVVWLDKGEYFNMYNYCTVLEMNENVEESECMVYSYGMCVRSDSSKQVIISIRTEEQLYSI